MGNSKKTLTKKTKKKHQKKQKNSSKKFQLLDKKTQKIKTKTTKKQNKNKKSSNNKKNHQNPKIKTKTKKPPKTKPSKKKTQKTIKEDPIRHLLRSIWLNIITPRLSLLCIRTKKMKKIQKQKNSLKRRLKHSPRFTLVLTSILYICSFSTFI